MSVFVEARRQLASSLCSLPCEDMVRSQQSATQKRVRTSLAHAGSLILDFRL